MRVKAHLTRLPFIGRTMLLGRGGMGELRKPPLLLWLDGTRKREMGRRLSSEIARAKTTKAELARKIGCTRATLTYACKEGTISVELLAEVCRHIGASLDFVVFGRHPAADPEFMDLLEEIKRRASRTNRH